MTPSPETIHFNIDVVKKAVNQLVFLKQVSNQPSLQQPHVLKLALYRYEKLWLPLASKWQGESLAAPLDIEWIWHCHLLSPVAYQRDCQRLGGIIVDHELFSGTERALKLQRSCSLWEAEYPHHSFEVSLNSSVSEVPCSFISQLSYDVISAASRQDVFYYQVSLPHYQDFKFLANSEKRYKKFLYLKQQNPNLFIVPCYDIDLIWHTHQLHPLAYKMDMEAILGRTFNHDDSVTDRREGSKLYTSDMETRELWKRTYGENFPLCGTMYRGNPSAGKIYAVSEEQCYNMAAKSAHIHFECIEIKNLPPIKGKIKLKLHTAANSKVVSTFSTLTGGLLWQDKKVAEVKFDTQEVNNLKFCLMEQTGFSCFGSKMVVAEKDFNMLTIINSLTQATTIDTSVSFGQVR